MVNLSFGGEDADIIVVFAIRRKSFSAKVKFISDCDAGISMPAAKGSMNIPFPAQVLGVFAPVQR